MGDGSSKLESLTDAAQNRRRPLLFSRCSSRMRHCWSPWNQLDVVQNLTKNEISPPSPAPIVSASFSSLSFPFSKKERSNHSCAPLVKKNARNAVTTLVYLFFFKYQGCILFTSILVYYISISCSSCKLEKTMRIYIYVRLKYVLYYVEELGDENLLLEFIFINYYS